ncbi:hypothetical protein BH23CHL5_BH23CHL5_19300 [soil metagenome]
MSIWVGAASRQGSTIEIAEAIATELQSHSLEATSAHCIHVSTYRLSTP